MGIEGTYLAVKKTTYDKPTANIILQGKKLKYFPLRSGIPTQRQGRQITDKDCSGRNHKQEEKTTVRMGENICKRINGQRINPQNT